MVVGLTFVRLSLIDKIFTTYGKTNKSPTDDIICLCTAQIDSFSHYIFNWNWKLFEKSNLPEHDRSNAPIVQRKRKMEWNEIDKKKLPRCATQFIAISNKIHQWIAVMAAVATTSLISLRSHNKCVYWMYARWVCRHYGEHSRDEDRWRLDHFIYLLLL